MESSTEYSNNQGCDSQQQLVLYSLKKLLCGCQSFMSGSGQVLVNSRLYSTGSLLRQASEILGHEHAHIVKKSGHLKAN